MPWCICEDCNLLDAPFNCTSIVKAVGCLLGLWIVFRPFERPSVVTAVNMFVCGMKAGSSEEEEEDVMDILQVCRYFESEFWFLDFH